MASMQINKLATVVANLVSQLPEKPYLDIQYEILKHALSQREDWCFPIVPIEIQAFKGEDVYRHVVRFYLKNVDEAAMNNNSVHNFPSSRRNQLFGEFLGQSTENMTFRKLRISFKGIIRSKLLRNYMISGRSSNIKLTNDFSKLVAALESLTIRREKWTSQSKKVQFCILIKIVKMFTKGTKLREFIIVYDWITDEAGRPLKCVRDTDCSQRKLVLKFNQLFPVPADYMTLKEPIRGGKFRMQQIYRWVARTGSVLVVDNLTEARVKGWIREFMAKSKDEKRGLL